MRIATVIGARPQFVKAAPVSSVLRQAHQEVLIHTGQHYDYLMSQVFFDELRIPEPDFNLGVGSGPHGKQTGEMLAKLEEIFLSQSFDMVLIYGDTNSTLAAALAAAKLHVPIAHVEAGLRSFNRGMPEEINRVAADHVSSLLFCPTATAVENLRAEGVRSGVHLVGDVMYEALMARIGDGLPTEALLEQHGLRPGAYVLATIHRAENTDHPERLSAILGTLCSLGEPVLLPVHPRTRGVIGRLGLELGSNLRLVEPLGFTDMLAAESSARVIVTDSGGVQKEAAWLGVPCVTVRDETEWVETVTTGWNTLVGADADALREAVRTARPPATPAPGTAERHPSQSIRALLEEWKPS